MGTPKVNSAKLIIGQYLLRQTGTGSTHFTTDELAEVAGLKDKKDVSEILRGNFPGIFSVKQGGKVELNGLISKFQDENIEYLRDIVSDLENNAGIGKERQP